MHRVNKQQGKHTIYNGAESGLQAILWPLAVDSFLYAQDTLVLSIIVCVCLLCCLCVCGRAEENKSILL